MAIDIAQLAAVRRGARVLRLHTVDCGRETVGQHSFGVAWLCQIIDPACRKELLLAALAHDLAEQQFGDIPSPTKRLPGLFDGLARAEVEWETRYGLFYHLTGEEENLLKLADLLDGYLFCCEERRRGNQNIEEVATNYWRYINALSPTGPALEVFNYAGTQWRIANGGK